MWAAVVVGLLPKVGADWEDDIAEAACPMFVRDEAAAWRQKSGDLIS